jgi:hypothetical protein
VNFGVTLVPGKKVATRLAKNEAGGAGFLAPVVLSHEVSWRKRNTGIEVNPTKPAVHLYAFVQEVCASINALIVGPATVPKSKHQWKTANALPLWWRKNISTSILGPRTPVIDPKSPPKNRETMKALKFSE